MKGYALKKWESTLNLCVHAHGYYVELVMKASCKSNCPLGINYVASMIFHSTFEYYPLVSRGYHAFALHLMNCDETMHIPVIAVSWFWLVVNWDTKYFCFIIPFARCR